MTREEFIKALEKVGGKYWETRDGTKHRVYFNPQDWIDKAGYDYLSNIKRKRVANSKVWYDLDRMGWFYRDVYSPVDLKEIINAIKEEVKKLGVDPSPKSFEEPKKKEEFPKGLYTKATSLISKVVPLGKKGNLLKIPNPKKAEEVMDNLLPVLRKAIGSKDPFAYVYVSIPLEFSSFASPEDRVAWAFMDGLVDLHDRAVAKKFYEMIHSVVSHVGKDGLPIVLIGLVNPEASEDWRYAVMIGPFCGRYQNPGFKVMFPKVEPSLRAFTKRRTCQK